MMTAVFPECFSILLFSSFFPIWNLQVREDPVFRRDGSDIHVDAPLSITQVKRLVEYFIG